ncbi:MAG: hypothetical protein FJX23_09565, partial [Alphaproteobacteria bacterium]|nr:hypothetical protein [Alphaproteobacteria bacterium]
MTSPEQPNAPKPATPTASRKKGQLLFWQVVIGVAAFAALVSGLDANKRIDSFNEATNAQRIRGGQESVTGSYLAGRFA